MRKRHKHLRSVDRFRYVVCELKSTQFGRLSRSFQRRSRRLFPFLELLYNGLASKLSRERFVPSLIENSTLCESNQLCFLAFSLNLSRT